MWPGARLPGVLGGCQGRDSHLLSTPRSMCHNSSGCSLVATKQVRHQASYVEAPGAHSVWPGAGPEELAEAIAGCCPMGYSPAGCPCGPHRAEASGSSSVGGNMGPDTVQ